MGEGRSYTPWIQIYDFPSWGLRKRSYSHISGRALHTLSILENQNALLAENEDDVFDIQENKPLLNTEKSLDIASDLKIDHPRASRSCPLIMSTDLRLSINSNGRTHFKIWTTKYTDELRDWRTLEKLRIDEAYWSSEKDHTWELKTESGLPKDFVANLDWLRPMTKPGALFDVSEYQILQAEAAMLPVIRRCTSSMSEIGHWCDSYLKLSPGSAQLIMRYLLATRRWRTDLRTAINPLRPLILKFA